MPSICMTFILKSYILKKLSILIIMSLKPAIIFNIGKILASIRVGTNTYFSTYAKTGMTIKLNILMSLYQCNKNGAMIIGTLTKCCRFDTFVLSCIKKMSVYITKND